MSSRRRAAIAVALASSLLLEACGGGTGPGSAGDGGPGPGPGGSGAGVLSRPAPAPVEPAWPEAPTAIPRFELTLAPGELAALEADPESDEGRPAHLRAPGYDGPVRVRYRGASSRALPKKSLRIEFPDRVRFDGRRKLNLLAGWLDAGGLGERIAADLAWALGAQVSTTTFVEVTVNGEGPFLYLEMERVDRAFLRAHGLDDDANVYREGGRDGELKLEDPAPWQQAFEKQTNEDAPSDDLRAFLELVNRTPPHELAQVLGTRVDLDGYLAVLAVQALISAVWIEDTRGYWISEGDGARWTYAPWDLNNSLLLRWRTWSPDDPPRVDRPLRAFTAYDPELDAIAADRGAGLPGYAPCWSVLATRVLDDPALRARLVGKLEDGLGLFAPERFSPYVNRLFTLIEPSLRADPHAAPDFLDGAVDHYLAYAEGRSAFLRRELPDLAAHGTLEPVVIDRVGPGFVELANRSGAVVTLDGWRLVDRLREPFSGALPPGLVVPAGGVLRLEGPDLPATVSPTGGELGLHHGTSLAGFADVLFYGPLPPGGYGRTPSGAEAFGPR